MHEVTSPQAFTLLRERGPQGPPPGPHARDDGPLDADAPARCRRPLAVLRRAERRRRSRRSSRTRGTSASSSTGSATRQQGVVHVFGPEHGRDAARDDGGLRRQPHRHARRVRRARVRHRHLRGRARPRDAVPAPAEADARSRSGWTGALQPGVTAKDLILAIIAQDRRRRRHRPRHGVHRPGGPRPLDGGPHDPLQHGDRGRRPRRPRRARRRHVPVARREARGRRRARRGTRRSRAGGSSRPTRARATTAR